MQKTVDDIAKDLQEFDTEFNNTGQGIVHSALVNYTKRLTGNITGFMDWLLFQVLSILSGTVLGHS